MSQPSSPTASPAGSATQAPPERAAVVAAWLPFALVVAAMLVFTLAHPLYQLLKAHGPVYYENGYDETTYLNYAYSLAVQSATRPGQYLVSALHWLGLSGGWVNVAFDVVVFLGFPLLVRAVLRRLGWSRVQSALGALLVMVGPQLVLTSNPLVAGLYRWALGSGMVYWITFPISANTPLARSPEPQFSLMLVGLATLAALRMRRYWPVYVALPFMYPFVSIPTAFVALACHLRARWPLARLATAGPLLVAFGAIGVACWGYYTFLSDPATRVIVVDSHLPLWPLTSTVALAAWALMRRWIAPEYRFFALALATAALVGTNQQVLSGHLPQPYNFDYYFGSVATAGVLALALRDRRGLGLTAFAVGAAMFFATSYQAFRLAQGFDLRLPMTPELARALKDDSAHVVVNDPINASLLGLVYPRQPFTALAVDRTYTILSGRTVGDYRCVKRQIERDYGHAFDAQIHPLDYAYVYGFQDYVFGSLNRRTEPYQRLHDVSIARCQEPGPLTLHYFFINWFPPPPRLSPAPGATGRKATQPSAPGVTR